MVALVDDVDVKDIQTFMKHSKGIYDHEVYVVYTPNPLKSIASTSQSLPVSLESSKERKFNK